MTRSIRRTRHATRAPSAVTAREPAAIQLFLFRAESFLGTQMFDGSRPVSIGRSSHSELMLQGDTISRHHCRLSLEDGQIWVEDLGSANGTYVNRVCVQDRLAVTPTDAIHLGAYTIKVRALRAASAPQLVDAAETEKITKVEAVLTLETDGQREAAVDISAGFDRRLYEDALRRATGRESILTPLSAVKVEVEPSSVDTEGEASEAHAAPESLRAAKEARAASMRSKSRADGGRPDPTMEARLRDLDELIAALDAREKSQYKARVQLEAIDGFLGRDLQSPVSLAFGEAAKNGGTAIDRATVDQLRDMSTSQFARDLASRLAVAGQVVETKTSRMNEAPKTAIDPIPPELDPDATEQMITETPLAKEPVVAEKIEVEAITTPSRETPVVPKDDSRPELEAPTTRAATRSTPVPPAAEIVAAKSAALVPSAKSTVAPSPAKSIVPASVVKSTVAPSPAKSVVAPSPAKSVVAAPAISKQVQVPPTAAIAAARAEAARKPTAIGAVSLVPSGASTKAPAPKAQSSSPPPLPQPRLGTVPRMPLGEVETDREDDETPIVLDKPKRSAASIRGAVPRGRSAMLDEPEIQQRHGKRLEAVLVTQTHMKPGVVPILAEAEDSSPLDDVWTRAGKIEPASPVAKQAQEKAVPPPLPVSKRHPASKVRSMIGGPENASSATEQHPRNAEFEAVEISARSRGALVDIAVLRKHGEQYVLGHKTPQGRLAPSSVHAGLRMLRINDDRTVDLVFPREVAGHLVRGKETVMFNELTEGRKYSCLRLETRDIATLILGEGQHAISYHIRFIRRAASAVRAAH